MEEGVKSGEYKETKQEGKKKRSTNRKNLLKTP